jgi:hypothetical protein
MFCRHAAWPHVADAVIEAEKRDHRQYTHYIGKAGIFTQATPAVNAWHRGQ